MSFMGRINNSWNFQELHFNTFCIIILGVLMFGVGEFAARKFIFKTKTKTVDLENYKYEIIRVDILKIFICGGFILLTTFLIYRNMKSITNVSGLSNVIGAYRLLTPAFNSSAMETGVKINTIYTQMFRACEIISLIFIYIIVNNLLAKDKFSNNIPYLVVVLLYIFLSFLLGGRANFLQSVVEAFMIWLILYKRTKKLSITDFIKIAVKIMIVVLPIFYFILPLFGRSTSVNLYNYITFYLGCPIPSFDVMLQNGITHSAHFGEMTLKGIQAFLNKFGLIDYYSLYERNWIYYSTGLYSNIFTAMFPPYVDFGIWGVIICQFLFGFVFAKMYTWAKKFSNRIYLLFYAYYANQLVDQFRREKLFTTVIHYNAIIYLILLLILTYFIFEKKKVEVGDENE
jgi:oligosaccharide repeat unit polymerase